ncbi:hypothetical protein GCM10010472_58330 [Pseudonocardia halophobica]|uniref:J domain-containing protein n=1 Tax=Pseudonocardia halophobica TaxID=29401 RepID=A0A9W6L447_9PSEU|nr:hypothetical protein [Pseudonocardia halophobica]GLL12693.1 hypothetical protein GCM10017577_38340 [Pseudonocardia halophobica]
MTDGDSGPEAWTREERAAYRAFVRDHHPDRGGDPEAFVEGLARLRAARAAPAPGTPDDRRYDAPVEIVPDLPLAVRIVVAAIRTARARARTRVDRPTSHPGRPDPDPGAERE